MIFLTYSVNNEVKSVVAERFMKTIKISANDNKSYLGYLNKLVDEYNNTYHHSICKKAY